MRPIQDVGQPFAGRVVTLIAAGHSTADYIQSVGDTDVVLINWSLALAPLFPLHSVYHVSMHPEVFGGHPCLRLPHVHQVTGEWAASLITLDVAARTLLFRTRQLDSLDDPLLAAAVTDPVCAVEGVLCHVANSSHCAIHLCWQWGCRDLRVIGANGYQGLPREHYDPRLNVPLEYQVLGAPAAYYIESFRRFVGLFPWRSVHWLDY